MAVNTNAPTPDHQFGMAAHSLPGAVLKQTRLAQSKTLADVTKGTNLPERHLLALEADRYETLPEATYVKGYIRTYAKFLGLQSDDLVRYYEEATGAVSNTDLMPKLDTQKPTTMKQELEALAVKEKANRNKGRLFLKLMMFALFFAAMIFIALQLPLQQWMDKVLGQAAVPAQVETPVVPTAPSVEPATVPATPMTNDVATTVTPAVTAPIDVTNTTTPPITATPSVTAVAQTPLVANGLTNLHLELTKDTEVTIFDESGNKLLEGKQAMGKTIDLQGKAPFQVSIPDATGVKLRLNSDVVDLTPHLKNGGLDLRLAP